MVQRLRAIRKPGNLRRLARRTPQGCHTREASVRCWCHLALRCSLTGPMRSFGDFAHARSISNGPSTDVPTPQERRDHQRGTGARPVGLEPPTFGSVDLQTLSVGAHGSPRGPERWAFDSTGVHGGRERSAANGSQLGSPKRAETTNLPASQDAVRLVNRRQPMRPNCFAIEAVSQ